MMSLHYAPVQVLYFLKTLMESYKRELKILKWCQKICLDQMDMNYTLLMMLSGKKVLLVSLVVSVDFLPLGLQQILK